MYSCMVSTARYPARVPVVNALECEVKSTTNLIDQTLCIYLDTSKKKKKAKTKGVVGRIHSMYLYFHDLILD